MTTGTQTPKPSPLATIRRHMSAAQASIATRGMTSRVVPEIGAAADEIANLAWTIEHLPTDQLSAFIAGMTSDPEL